ncbi:RING-type domain-containing protein, partial [Haematococcus lacustris]
VPRAIAPHFRLRSPPPFTAVLRHLQTVGEGGGEELLSSWPSGCGVSAEAAFGQVLEYLEKEGLGSDKLAQLRPLAFLPVANATRLVPPGCLFIRLKEELSPLGYELPPVYTKYLELLRQLGVRDEPGAQALLAHIW